MVVLIDEYLSSRHGDELVNVVCVAKAVAEFEHFWASVEPVGSAWVAILVCSHSHVCHGYLGEALRIPSNRQPSTCMTNTKIVIGVLLVTIVCYDFLEGR